LTELLSVVLVGHQEFAHRLLERAGLPVAGPVEVSTQVRTRKGKRVDMEVLAYDGDGRNPIGRLWSEHKTGSVFSKDQLPGYAAELAKFTGPTQLITITDRLDEVEDDPRWKALTWAQLGGIAVELGRASGRLWREDACRTGSAGGPRLLHELLSYLEEDRNLVLDPLSHLDIIAFARANQVSAVLTSLLDRAGEYSRYETDGDAVYDKNDWGLYTIGLTIPESWPEKLGGAFELQVSAEDTWAYERVGEPAFGIGVWLPDKYADPLRSSGAQGWRDGITANGFSASVDDGDNLRITKTMYVAEILAAGPLLDGQARLSRGGPTTPSKRCVRLTRASTLSRTRRSARAESPLRSLGPSRPARTAKLLEDSPDGAASSAGEDAAARSAHLREPCPKRVLDLLPRPTWVEVAAKICGAGIGVAVLDKECARPFVQALGKKDESHVGGLERKPTWDAPFHLPGRIPVRFDDVDKRRVPPEEVRCIHAGRDTRAHVFAPSQRFGARVLEVQDFPTTAAS
jgi:hypothetical protein